MDKVQELRELVFGHIKRCLEEDSHCKSYEGSVHVVYPNYFDEPDDFKIELHCYLIGPTRRYEWRGKSIDECCDRALADCKNWIAEEETYDTA